MASGESMVWSSRLAHPTHPGVLIWPSTITCETWIPCGPNSRAMDWASARNPNLPTARAEKFALPRSAAEAPVSSMVPRRPRPSRGAPVGRRRRPRAVGPEAHVELLRREVQDRRPSGRRRRCRRRPRDLLARRAPSRSRRDRVGVRGVGGRRVSAVPPTPSISSLTSATLSSLRAMIGEGRRRTLERPEHLEEAVDLPIREARARRCRPSAGHRRRARRRPSAPKPPVRRPWPRVYPATTTSWVCRSFSFCQSGERWPGR